MDYSEFLALNVAVEDGIATVTMGFEGGDEKTRNFQHSELGRIWRTLDADPDVRCVLLTGTGENFYLSGKPPGAQARVEAEGDRAAMWEFTLLIEREVNAIFYEMINFSKPLVAAVNGTAAGAGLTVAVLSDISVMAEDAILFDPHVMLGLSAGDGLGGIMPLLTGLTKAKLYLLTSDALDGREAERIGLVSRAVPREQVMEVASDYARRLAAGPPVALRFTKRGLNQWLRLAGIVGHDYSFALEAVSDYSGERPGAPWTDWPPRKVP
jgi:enoyl-CoA hydratase